MLHAGMRMRIAHCTLIYRKALKLSRKSQGESSIGMQFFQIVQMHKFNEITIVFQGQMVNLLSNDVTRFEITSGLINFHFLWIGPIQLLIIMLILFQTIGSASLVGGALITVFIPLLGIDLGKL